MPYALCPMPYALCPMPSRTSYESSKGYISLVTLAQDKQLLVANFSALIADSVTLKNFTRELSLSYSAYTCQEEPADEPMQ